MSSEALAASSARPLLRREPSSAGIHLRYGLTGLMLGAALTFIGFGSFDEVHRMFTFADLRLFFTFLGAVTLLGLAFFGIRSNSPALPRRPLHRGIIPGSTLFGIGWALTGACPAIALVQLGEGKLYALATLTGILVGTWSYGRMQGKLFRWNTGSCEGP
ncbi:MAG: YeeE/YedE thiosulfate transporter family protein [Myxococcaceae bacterium]